MTFVTELRHVSTGSLASVADRPNSRQTLSRLGTSEIPDYFSRVLRRSRRTGVTAIIDPDLPTRDGIRTHPQQRTTRSQTMAVRLGDEAPDFTADTTDGELRFHEWKGDSWAVLFSHPKDFTPVCTTELGTVAKLKDEFEKRNTKVIGLSVDPIEDHHEWAKDIEETQGAALNFPMIADPDRVVADLYDMIHPNASNTLTVRSVFVIGPDNTVKLTLTYPASTGRNFQELLRVIDSLQLTSERKVATPADWTDGDRAIIVPALSNEDAKELFPQGWEEQKPYLRLVDLNG